MFSWEYDILRTLLRHKAGPHQDTIKIELGSKMLLALWRPLSHQLLRVIGGAGEDGAGHGPGGALGGLVGGVLGKVEGALLLLVPGGDDLGVELLGLLLWRLKLWKARRQRNDGGIKA